MTHHARPRRETLPTALDLAPLPAATGAIPMVLEGCPKARAIGSRDEVPGGSRMPATLPGFEIDARGLLAAPRGLPSSIRDRPAAETPVSPSMRPGQLRAVGTEAFLRHPWTTWGRVTASTGVSIPA